MDNKWLYMFPKVDHEELRMIMEMVKDLSEDELKVFANLYNSRRKEPELILLLCLIGFLGVAGVHRFFLNNIGMGVLYLLTGGLCLIGTIVDAVNYKKLTQEYNYTAALETVRMVKMAY